MAAGFDEMNARPQVRERRRAPVEPERCEEVKVVFRFVPRARAPVVVQAIGEREQVEPPTVSVADPSRYRRRAARELGVRVWVQMHERVGAAGAERRGQRATVGRQRNEAVEQRMAFEQRPHGFLRRKKKPRVRAERGAQRREKRRRDDDVADAIGTGEKEIQSE